MIKNIFNKSISLLMNDRIKIVSERPEKVIFEIFDEFDESKHILVMQRRHNQVTFDCDCYSSSNCFNVICSHKLCCLDYYKSKLLKLR